MSLALIKTLDGDDIADHWTTTVKDLQENVKTFNLDDALDKYKSKHEGILGIIVTPLMVRSLNKLGDSSFKTLLEDSAKTIFLYQCQTSDVNKIKQRTEHISENTSDLFHFDLSQEDQTEMAEVRIRRLIRSVKSDVPMPSLKKFIVEPDIINEGTTHLKVILLEDGKSHKDVKIQFNDGNVTPEKIRDGVWMFKLTELNPGNHQVQVNADGEDFGSTTVCLKPKLDGVCEALVETVRDTPVAFLCRVFNLSEDNFDEEFADLTNDRTEEGAFFHCIDHLLRIGGAYPTCLHFAARFHLQLSSKKMLDRRYGLWAKLETDKEGRTPYAIAVEEGFEYLKNILKPDTELTDGTDELVSPLRKTSRPVFFGGSFDEEPPCYEESGPRRLKRDNSEGRRLNRCQRGSTGKLERKKKHVSSQPRDSGNSSSPSAGSLDTQSSEETTVQRRSSRTRVAASGGKAHLSHTRQRSASFQLGDRVPDGEQWTQTVMLSESKTVGTTKKYNFNTSQRAVHQYEAIQDDAPVISKREHHYNDVLESNQIPSGTMTSHFNSASSLSKSCNATNPMRPIVKESRSNSTNL